MDFVAISDTAYRILGWIFMAVVVFMLVCLGRLLLRFRAAIERIEAELDDEDRHCRVCGCTDAEACWPNGCDWVDDDLCSECIARADG